MSLTNDPGKGWPKAALALFVLFGACTKQASESDQGSSSAVPKAGVAPSGSATAVANASGRFGCHTLLPKARRTPRGPETIRLQPPDPAEKTIVLNKTGVIGTFSRDEFLVTARCLGLQQAVNNLEAETGYTKESPLRDAFGLSYVAAALLDVGRVGIRLKTETEPRRTIVRDAWSPDRCTGKCPVGRVYQLTEADPFPFFRVVDGTEP